MSSEMPSCRIRFRQEIFLAAALERLLAGNSIAARMAMMAMTTSSSIRVNARRRPWLELAAFMDFADGLIVSAVPPGIQSLFRPDGRRHGGCHPTRAIAAVPCGSGPPRWGNADETGS